MTKSLEEEIEETALLISQALEDKELAPSLGALAACTAFGIMQLKPKDRGPALATVLDILRSNLRKQHEQQREQDQRNAKKH